MRRGQQRAGFGHAIAGVHVNTEFGASLTEALSKRTAADQHMPVTEVRRLDRFGGHQHLHNGGYTVGESHPVLL